MIQLFLDGIEVSVADKASIRFTAENPFFTKSASYTYEVELPTRAKPNRDIFGYIDRLDTPKVIRSFTARLVVDNRELLSGTAHVTSITDTSVKVQLLGSAAAYNYGNKMDDIFVDSLDLGDWLTTTFPDLYPAGKKFTADTSQLVTVIAGEGITGRPGLEGTGGSKPSENTVTFPTGFQPWVIYPVLNSTAEILCNTYSYFETAKDSRNYTMYLRTYSGVQGSREDSETPVNTFCVQPYVWIMAEKVAQATGFTLSREDNALYTNDFFRRIFIVNANNYISCSKCLPHWSVNEFWTEVENTFGLVMQVDYATKRMTLRSRTDFYRDRRREAMTVLDLVLDEFSVDIDDETRKDISVNNVGFADFDNGSEDLLSEFIISNADIEEGDPDVSAVLAKVKAQTGDRKETYRRTLFRCSDGRQYIYASDCGADSGDRTDLSVQTGSAELNGGRVEHVRPAGKGEGLAEVNMFRPRISENNNDEIGVELRFVPARYVSVDANVYEYNERHTTATASRDKPVATFPVTVLECPGIGDLAWCKQDYNEDIDLEAIINGEADETAERGSECDLIYIAIDNPDNDSVDASFKIGSQELSRTLPHPRPLLRERTLGLISGGVTVTDPGLSLSLIPIEGQRNLASETVSSGLEIDTLTRHCIRFIHDRIPDVTSIFNIRNRLFVCEKIEADIRPAGLGKLMTG